MWHWWINTTRSNPNPRKSRIERRENKIGCPKVSSSVGDVLREWLVCTPSRQKKARQEGKFPTDTIPEVVIQEGMVLNI